MVMSAIVAISAFTAYEGYEARQDAKEAAQNAQQEQKKVQAEQKAANAQKQAEEQRKQVREERVRRARILQASANGGTAGSSGEAGATSALSTNLSSNLGYNGSLAGIGDRIGSYSQNAADFQFQTQSSLMDAQTYDQLFGLSMSIFSASSKPAAAANTPNATGAGDYGRGQDFSENMQQYGL